MVHRSEEAKTAPSTKDATESGVYTSLEKMAQTPGFSYGNFENIDPAKQKRITRAALEEFAKHGYAQVSTNMIVEKAGISKGLLFHYFTSKAGLFCYLQKMVVEALSNAVVDEVDLNGGDVFEILRRSTDAKLQVAAQLPLEVQFYVRSILDTSMPADTRSLIDRNVDLAYGMMTQIVTNLDDALLKPELDKEKVAKVIALVCEGITQEVVQELTPDISLEFWNQKTRYVEEYFAFLRQLFYRETFIATDETDRNNNGQES